MPELPEVECVRRSLARLVEGRRVSSVRVNRAGVIRGSGSDAALLVGDVVSRVLRHGKQLAIVGESGGVVSVHLGMSGQLCATGNAGDALTQRTASRIGSMKAKPEAFPAHTHVVWRLESGLVVRFTDPRRFGGLWTFASEAALVAERWSRLGPDALWIGPAALGRGLSGTRRCLKAALLDQRLVAGLGNIYVDELLFGAGLHPLSRADRLPGDRLPSLVRRMRTLLRGAIERGGSSLRDYVDADNRAGQQQTRHRVYGRAGERCKRRGCRARIESDQIAGRTTCWCPSCQRL
ncbi:MAG: bifunctional DNA-formamidopyrimidine glycosylase/DNA-(apurinic or apyrimidinic site) lyase [Phycisphaeraceae bacterium]